jgi:hypothetical protein
MEPRSQRLGGLLTTTDGLEQKADIKPGKQTPGQRLGWAVVVVEGLFVVEATFGLVVVGRTVVVVPTEGFELLGEGRAPEVGAVTLFVFCSLIPPLPSRRLMQHLPPLAQTAFESIKSHRYEKNPVTQVPYNKIWPFTNFTIQMSFFFFFFSKYFAAFVVASCWSRCRRRFGSGTCCCSRAARLH